MDLIGYRDKVNSDQEAYNGASLWAPPQSCSPRPGAYAFGLTISKVRVEDGRERVKCGLRRPHSELDVLLQDQHEGYVTWSEFERTSV